MTSNPLPITRRCEDCRFVATTIKVYRCPKCGGWLLSLRDADAAAIEANPIVQAVTVGQYLSAVKTINRRGRRMNDVTIKQAESANTG